MRLDSGACLDVNVMVRAGLRSGTCKLILTNGQRVSAELRVDHADRRGWLRFRLRSCAQAIGLTAVVRYFGGRQWYWLCPMTGDRCTVLWMPYGQTTFASQKYWRRRRMAYGSQFLAPHNRARLGIKRIEERLGSKDDEDTLWKPKWQRWRTFKRYCARLDKYDEIIAAREQELDARLVRTVYRLQRRR